MSNEEYSRSGTDLRPREVKRDQKDNKIQLPRKDPPVKCPPESPHCRGSRNSEMMTRAHSCAPDLVKCANDATLQPHHAPLGLCVYCIVPPSQSGGFAMWHMPKSSNPCHA